MLTITEMKNGLMVIVEEIPHIESAAYDLLIPGGIILDQSERVGTSLILGELTSRGAGDMDARALSNAFDDLGIRHGEAASQDRYLYRGSLLSENLEAALTYVSLMVQKPTLPADQIDSIKSLLLQDIGALVDNPARRVMVELNKRYYPAPFNRPALGTKEGIEGTTLKDLREEWERCFHPKGAVLSIAGKVDTKSVLAMVQTHFGAWQGATVALPLLGALHEHESAHIEFEAAQLQIAMAYPASKFGDPDYYVAKVFSGILSGGMFGRLFIEVREKRGLCYSVYARHHATKEYGAMTAYAGTTPERAQETLDVMLAEFRRVRGTVSAEELARAKANIKSSLVIGEESPGARASSNASDWWVDRHVRSLDEIHDGIERVTADDIDAFIERHPVDRAMVMTLGAKALTLTK